MTKIELDSNKNVMTRTFVKSKILLTVLAGFNEFCFNVLREASIVIRVDCLFIVDGFHMVQFYLRVMTDSAAIKLKVTETTVLGAPLTLQ